MLHSSLLDEKTLGLVNCELWNMISETWTLSLWISETELWVSHVFSLSKSQVPTLQVAMAFARQLLTHLEYFKNVAWIARLLLKSGGKFWDSADWISGLPSGKHTKNEGKSPCYISG